MADVAAWGEESDSWNKFRDRSNYVWLDESIGYYFHLRVDATADFADGAYYNKTTDGGQNWSSAVDIFRPSLGIGDTEAIDVWWDKWTPGDTGGIIHILLFTNDASTTSRFGHYYTLDTVDDTLTQIENNIRSSSATGLCNGRSASICKMEDGTLHVFVPWDVGGIYRHELWRSTNSGVDWTEIASVDNIQLARYVIYPTDSADDNDVLVIIWDVAGDDSVVAYAWDDSAGSFTQAELGTTGDFVRTNQGPGNIWSSAFRQSDKTTLVAVHEDVNHGSHDLRFFTVHWDGTTLTVTEKAAIFTAQTYGPEVAITIDNNNNTIYAAYGEGTLGSTVITMVKSVDGGTTWESPTQMSDDDTDYRSVWAAPQIVGNGRIHPLFDKPAPGADSLQHQFLANTFTIVPKPVLSVCLGLEFDYEPFFGGTAVPLELCLKVETWKEIIDTGANVLATAGITGTAVTISSIGVIIQLDGIIYGSHVAHPEATKHNPDLQDLEEWAILVNRKGLENKATLTLSLPAGDRVYTGVVKSIDLVEEGGVPVPQFSLLFQALWNVSKPAWRGWATAP